MEVEVSHCDNWLKKEDIEGRRRGRDDCEDAFMLCSTIVC